MRDSEKWAVAFIGLVFSIFFIQTIQMGVLRENGNDLNVFMRAADIFFKGGDPYLSSNYLTEGMVYYYPLFCTFIFELLNFIPTWAAHSVWYLINVALLVLSVLIVRTYIEDKNIDIVVFALTLLILLDPLQSNFLNGQINIMILACSLLFMASITRNRTVLAALFLAIGVSLKLSPALFMVYLVVEKKWRIVLLSAAFILVLNLFLPFLVAGSKSFVYLARYPQLIMHKINGSESSYHLIYMVIVLLCFAATVHLHYFSARERSSSPIVLYAYFIVSVMAGGMALQKHYLVWLMPPILLAVTEFRWKTWHEMKRNLHFISVIILICVSLFIHVTDQGNPVFLAEMVIGFFIAYSLVSLDVSRYRSLQ